MKNLLSSTIVALLFVGLLGCGKSEAAKAAEQQAIEKHDARQNFREKVAAVKVRTQGSTQDEFRQAELDLKTCFEVNKSFLNDVSGQFAQLSDLMGASDYCWNRHVLSAFTFDNRDLKMMLVINPSMASNSVLLSKISEQKSGNLSMEDYHRYIEFPAPTFVESGLSQINKICDQMMDELQN